jgi:hypothetical protein
MKWRRTLILLHRDAGFLCLGVTLIYAISGMAVNHREHWNYNKYSDTEVTQVGKPAELLGELPAERRKVLDADLTTLTAEEEKLLRRRLREALGRTAEPQNAFWRGPDELSLFFKPGDKDTVNYRPSTGAAEQIRMRDRWLLRQLNFLHLNESKGIWTYVADVFAVLLAFLAISGVIVVKGRRGLRGRGGVLLAIGIAIPVLGYLLATLS